jgi:hypothetical protein
MTQYAWVALAALLLYFALRVWRLKRPTLPFLIAYPLFVAILVGGALATFIGASRTAASLGYGAEDPVAMFGIFGVTGLASLVLWWIARRIIS